MAIVIRRKHHLDEPTLRARVQRIAEQLAGPLKMDYDWEDDRLVFRRRGLDGHIDVGGDEVVVRISKSALVPVSSAWIRRQVEDQIDRHLR